MSNVYIYTLPIRSWVLIEQRIVVNGELFIHSTPQEIQTRNGEWAE